MALYWKDVNGRNWPVCSCLKAWLTAYQNELLRVGEIKYGLDVYQTIGGAVKSAGYHLYGGCVDTGQTSKRAITIARNMGGAAFGRGPADGMDPHCHIALKGCPHMRGGPRWQVTELVAGRDGLMGRDRDRGPRTGIKWPLRTYKQGIEWAKQQEDTMALTDADITKIWETKNIPGPYPHKSFPDGRWTAKAVIDVTAKRAVQSATDAAATLALTKVLVERGTSLTAADITAAVKAGIEAKIDTATVNLTTNE